MRSHFAADPHASGLMVALDHVAVQLVNRICESAACKIVISSSWRSVYGYHETCCHLRAAGLHAKHLYLDNSKSGSTPEAHGLRSRGAEIKAYIDQYPGTHGYVILDDSTDMLQEQMPHFVKTDAVNGLMYEHMVKAIEILKEIRLNPVATEMKK